MNCISPNIPTPKRPYSNLQHPIFLKKKAIFKLQIVYFRCSLQMCFLYISEKKRPMNHDNCVGDDGSVKQNAWGSSFPQRSVLLLLPSLPAQHPIQPNARGRGRDIPCPAHAAPSCEPIARLGGGRLIIPLCPGSISSSIFETLCSADLLAI